ncbi:MAG TPA: glycosyltransferase [Terracidiphilus sp.]|nr:glycosyltransferase [Terracidiphilus sp.]
MNRIAYLIPTIDRIGGAEQQVLQLATGMATRGWRVSVIALSGNGGDVAKTLPSAGVTFHSLGMRKGLLDPRGWLRLHAWISQNRPDVLHGHLPHASLLARWSRVASPVPAVVDTIHSPATGGLVRHIGYRVSTGLVDVVTAVSRAAAESWLEAGLVAPEKLAIVPNGVDTNRWKRDEVLRTAKRRELGFSNEFLWLAVGRLDAVKNHATLLRAFARIPHHSRLVIAGEGPLHGSLRSLALELQLGERVTFPGFQKDIYKWMQAADGFVLCSSWEGLPMSLLEAAACELPAVITDIPGSREVLPGSRGVAAVPVRDPDALAAAMSAMMRLPLVERHEIGRSLRRSVCTRFGLNAVLTQWEDLYRALLEKNPQPSRFAIPASALGKTLQLQ